MNTGKIVFTAVSVCFIFSVSNAGAEPTSGNGSGVVPTISKTTTEIASNPNKPEDRKLLERWQSRDYSLLLGVLGIKSAYAAQSCSTTCDGTKYSASCKENESCDCSCSRTPVCQCR